MYDLLVKGGVVIDPENKVNGKFDLAVEDGKIVCITPKIDPSLAKRVLNVTGKTVVPGIIDMHVHTAFPGKSRAAMSMMVKAGTVTAVDCGGPLHEFYAHCLEDSAGMNMACLEMIRPHWNVGSNDPGMKEISTLVDQSLAEGAIGMKLLGGHYPMTPEATHTVIEVANQKQAYVCFHVGTTRNGAANLNSFKEATELSEGLSIHIAHMNTQCRGQILGDPVEETLEVLRVLETHPNIFSESYLSVFSASPGTYSNGELESNGPKNSLSMAGYEQNERGLKQAILDGFASVVCDMGEENICLTSEEGLKYFTEHQSREVTVTFPITPAATRFLLATQKGKTGRFLVDGLATDGGFIPRNFIVEKGTALVRMEMLTWGEFVLKTSTNPARILGLNDKGHLGLGADADMTILEGTSGNVYSTINSGRIIMLAGVVLGQGTTVLTAEQGVNAVTKRGLQAKKVDLLKGWFYGGRPPSLNLG
ncbi:MAG: amidohydrolase family protein [Desulfitobacteriaceae bacterium]